MTKEEVDKINEEYRENHTPHPNGYINNDSPVTHPDEDNKKRSMVDGIIADLSNQRNDIDQIKSGMEQLIQMINQQTQALNNLAPSANVQPSTTQAQPQQAPINMEGLAALGDVAEKLVSAYKNLKGNPASIADPFTQQITDNAKAEAIESLNIVHLINKKVKGKLVQDIAGSIAGSVINDSDKTNVHEPQ